ncbi:MAG: ABC transporter permease subunit [Oscillospiraceae bacterium]|jgi:sodium transport system permease protein|nr:ABC transporter permease subunit [Oscillospiraceae bacterium]
MKSYTGIIFRKELLDIFRDRRSIIMTFLLPLVLYPLMFWFMGSQVADEIEGPSEVTVALSEGAESFRELLRAPVFSDANIRVAEPEDRMAALRDGTVELVIEQKTLNGLTHYDLIYDSNKTSSSMAMNHVTGYINEYVWSVQADKLAEIGITLDTLAPLSYGVLSRSFVEGTEESGAGIFLSMMLPMLMVILLSVGGMATAVDLFAGEKERRTFEPLLCTGARRADILAGKLGAVTTMSLLSALASALGLAAGYIFNPKAMTLGLDDAQGLAIPPSTALFVLLIIAVTAVFFSGLHILLSTYARTVKEASTYGSFVMLASYVPVFASMTKLGGDFEFWTAFIPIMNVTGCLKMALAGISNPAYMALTFGLTAVFVAVVLLLGRYMFKKENIMLRA